MRTLRHFPLAMAGTTLAFALSVSAMTASAASTFLLQFGQHPTEEAARAQWDALQRSHPDLLRDMSVRIAQVDGGFRTQASGVSSRDAAQATCSQLANAEVPCLVVETSMYTPEPLPQKFTLSSNLASQPEEPAVEYAPAQEMEGASPEGMTPAEQAAIEPAAAPEKKSFAQRFLPWLGGDEEETGQAQPQEPVLQAEALRPERIDQMQRVEQPVIPQPVDRAAAAQMSEELAQQRPQPQQQPLQVPAPVQAAPAQEGQVVASRAPRTLQAPQSAPVQPVQAQPVEPVRQAPVQPQVDSAPVQPMQGEAQIEVAEAIQVPLSFGNNAAPVPVNKPVGHGGFPSQPIPERTLWVQLNHFANKDAAMAYWRQLTAQNPEMMRLLRVRIVTPWRTPGAGAQYNSAATLRMGPFADRAEINRICEVAKQQNLRCILVQESGTSAALGTARRQPAAVENYSRRVATSRGYATTPGVSPAGMFWVQLGAFGSVDEARKRWDELGAIHADVLGRMQPQISYPALSSSPTPVYHLRTGPFVSKSSAMNTCNSLQNRHVGCVVVQAR